MNKPIELVHIDFSGDPSVGIQPGHFEAQVFIDPSCVDDPKSWLEEIRGQFEKLYTDIEGEPATVTFDFEIEAREPKGQYAGELWEADPSCEHNVQPAPGGGVICTKCPGWFCY